MSSGGDFIARLDALVERHRRFDRFAYLTLYQALDRAQRKHGTGHVGAEPLLEAFRELMLERYGGQALIMADLWNLRSTSDIGEMVFQLVEADLLSKSEHDRREDFEDVFAFDAVFPLSPPEEAPPAEQAD